MKTREGDIKRGEICASLAGRQNTLPKSAPRTVSTIAPIVTDRKSDVVRNTLSFTIESISQGVTCSVPGRR